jgi:hypothetical protein
MAKVVGEVEAAVVSRQEGCGGVGRGAIKVSGARRVFSRDDAPSVHVLGKFRPTRQAGAQRWEKQQVVNLKLRI